MKIITIFLSFIIISKIYSQEIDFEKLNKSYYNLNDYDFNGFSADVQFDLLDNIKKSIKDEKYLSVLNNISIELKFYSKDSLEFLVSEIEQTDNQQFNKGLEQTLKGVEQSVRGFLETWSELNLTPKFEPAKYNYNIINKSDHIELQYEQDGSEITIFLNNSLNEDSISIKSASAIVKMYPTFEETTFDKKIIKSILTSINDFLEVRIEIIYKDFDNIKIPYRIKINQSMQNSSQELNLTFDNIKLLK